MNQRSSEKELKYYSFLEKLMKGYDDLEEGFSAKYLLQKENQFNTKQKEIILDFFEKYKEIYQTELKHLWHPSKEEMRSMLEDPNKDDYSEEECAKAATKYFIENMDKFFSIEIKTKKLTIQTLDKLLITS